MSKTDFTVPQKLLIFGCLIGLTIIGGVHWVISRLTGKPERPVIDLRWW